MRQGDSVIFVGNEKSGKSLWIFQLICALTSGQPFLDKYSVSKPSRIAYFQLEGELNDSQDRMKRMIKTLEFNPDLLSFYFYPPLELHNKEYAQSLCNRISENGGTDVLIIDPIYFAFAGSLSNDEVIRNFIGNIRVMKDILKCAVILVHHTHKTKFSVDGYKIDEGDDALFGSKFLKAWADHIIMFHYDKQKMVRTMSCSTQRSGDIEKECQLRLIEPNPLYFETLSKKEPNGALIMNLLCTGYKDGIDADTIVKRLKISKNSFYESTKSLLADNIIMKLSTRPVLYIYNWEKFKNENPTDGK